MATTTATNSAQASPSPFPSTLLSGFPARNFPQQVINTSSASSSSTPASSTSTTSTGSAHLPNGMFQSPGGQQHQQQMSNLFNSNYYTALMQSQWMQQFVKQYMNVASAGMTADTSANVESRSPSTTAVSPSFMQQQKKLPLDADGNLQCPICDQKVGPELWSAHVDLERASLAKSIESLKESNQSPSLQIAASNYSLAFDSRKKREFELSRIRSNQQKRLSMKDSLLSGYSLNLQQNLLSAPLQQNSKFTVGALCDTRVTTSPQASGNMLATSDANYCKSCKRAYEFLIIASGLDEPRCMNCYRKYRRQVGALPLTITESPTDEHSISAQATPTAQRNGSHTASSASPPNHVRSASSLSLRKIEDEHDELLPVQIANKLEADEQENEIAAKRQRFMFSPFE